MEILALIIVTAAISVLVTVWFGAFIGDIDDRRKQVLADKAEHDEDQLVLDFDQSIDLTR